VRRSNLEHAAQRLLHAAGGELDKRPLHGVDQVIHRQDAANVTF
jgi:hypothetical protein